jgi:hypothetical protein
MKYGNINYRQRAIRVAKNLWNRILQRYEPLTAEERWETYWHEVVHGILHDMGRHDLNNERFVTAFCRRLYKAMKGK